MTAEVMTEKMSEASATTKFDPPKKGERFRCENCGMEVQVTKGCGCQEAQHVRFECCGQALTKV